VHVRRDLPNLPALLDLGMTAGRRRQRTAAPRLLGSYPVPTLHLVGADVPPGPRAPSRWQPAPPPPQHGVDYAFARRHGLTPVRWRPGIVITVRLTSQAGSRPAVRVAAEAVDAVLAELRELTGLDLQGGPPLARPIDIRRVPDQEIHVAYLPMAQARQARRLAGDRIPGGAMPARDGAWYRRGWAIVATDLAIEPAPPAVSVAGLAVLRHQLCHALGLGHAARRQVLMHQRIPVDLDGYSSGDRHGLALLGEIQPVRHAPPPPPADERTIPCC
jgi:hypothetical protein